MVRIGWDTQAGCLLELTFAEGWVPCAVVDPGCDRRGEAAIPEVVGANLLFWLLFSENCMKMKEIDPAGGRRLECDPPPWHPIKSSQNWLNVSITQRNEYSSCRVGRGNLLFAWEWQKLGSPPLLRPPLWIRKCYYPLFLQVLIQWIPVMTNIKQANPKAKFRPQNWRTTMFGTRVRHQSYLFLLYAVMVLQSSVIISCRNSVNKLLLVLRDRRNLLKAFSLNWLIVFKPYKWAVVFHHL